MPHVPMKPVISLKVGDRITPRLKIDKTRVQFWKYSRECVSNFSPIAAGSEMEIFEVEAMPGRSWVKVYLPNTHNTMHFKIAGEELSSLFLLVQN